MVILLFRGFYTVASGMIAQQRRTEMLTNNMANANTPGFKADQSVIRSFPDMLMSRLGNEQIPTDDPMQLKSMNRVGAINAGIYMQETLPLFTQGQVKDTELPTDFALIDGVLPIDEGTGKPGALFFRLESQNEGESYTRNGNFTLDADGFLVNPQGLYVLSDTGTRIQLQNDDFKVDGDGRIFVGDLEENRIGISFAQTPDTLMKTDNGLYRTADQTILPSAYTTQEVSFSIQQGFLEGSNVDAARTMTDMLTAYRAFEANQKVLQAYDRSMEKTVNEIGRV